MMNHSKLDKIHIRDLLIRGILGIKPDEREKRQDILINATLWGDTRPAGKSEKIEDAINYRTVTKAIIAHIEQERPFLVERLVADLARLAFETDHRIQAVEINVEKPGALRFARSVGITIYRTRVEVMGDE